MLVPVCAHKTGEEGMVNDLVTLIASVLFHKKSVKTLWDAMGSASRGKLDVGRCHLKG